MHYADSDKESREICDDLRNPLFVFALRFSWKKKSLQILKLDFRIQYFPVIINHGGRGKYLLKSNLASRHFLQDSSLLWQLYQLVFGFEYL